jgi:isopenicillin N synthase-like dioxygenase
MATPPTTEQALTPVSMSLPRAALAARLIEDFTRTGFAVVTNHGIDLALIAAADAAARAFFALPEADKRRWHVPGMGGQRGYTPFGTEAAKGEAEVDQKEFWHVGRELPAGHPYRAEMPDNVWPDVPEFRDASLALYAAFDAAGARLLEAIAVGLGLMPDFFVEPTKDGNSILRYLHYPPQPARPSGIRAAAHEDINTITLLLGAEERGLQLLTRGGEWLAIDVPTGALVVNVGDMLQRLTNHVLPSTTHRVVNPVGQATKRARFSMPFFLHFAPDYLIETLPSCITRDNPNRYPEPITANGYLYQRLKEIRLI